MPLRRGPLLVVPVLALLAACAGPDGRPGRVQVVTGAYPFAWLAQQVAGEDAEVVNLVKPGAEPHDIELTAQQVALVKDAALVVRAKGFQPAVDDAVGGSAAGLDLVAVTGGSADPHVWLDPVRMKTAAGAIATRLASADPANAGGYRSRLAAVTARLDALDAVLRGSLTGCARREVVTSHEAFGYLTARYGLVQKGISGLQPDAEPSPKRVAEVAAYARSRGVTTIFFETLVDPKVARTVAQEIGARTAVLDPVENARGSDDYLSLMRRNAAALREALGCR